VRKKKRKLIEREKKKTRLRKKNLKTLLTSGGYTSHSSTSAPMLSPVVIRWQIVHASLKVCPFPMKL
jgi:hypothetical protein